MTITTDKTMATGVYGVYYVTITLVSGKTKATIDTTFNPAQADYCIRRAARRVKVDYDKIDSVTIKLKI